MNNTPFILLIEDDKAIVNFMNTVLCANQYRVLHAQTGREALLGGVAVLPDKRCKGRGSYLAAALCSAYRTTASSAP